jgi:hypothetical protein
MARGAGWVGRLCRRGTGDARGEGVQELAQQERVATAGLVAGDTECFVRLACGPLLDQDPDGLGAQRSGAEHGRQRIRGEHRPAGERAARRSCGPVMRGMSVKQERKGESR